MAKCDICEKGIMFGRRISITRSQISSRALSKRKPNVRKVKVMDGETPSTMHVCAKCLRSGAVKRA